MTDKRAPGCIVALCRKRADGWINIWPAGPEVIYVPGDDGLVGTLVVCERHGLDVAGAQGEGWSLTQPDLTNPDRLVLIHDAQPRQAARLQPRERDTTVFAPRPPTVAELLGE